MTPTPSITLGAPVAPPPSREHTNMHSTLWAPLRVNLDAPLGDQRPLRHTLNALNLSPQCLTVMTVSNTMLIEHLVIDLLECIIITAKPLELTNLNLSRLATEIAATIATTSHTITNVIDINIIDINNSNDTLSVWPANLTANLLCKIAF